MIKKIFQIVLFLSVLSVYAQTDPLKAPDSIAQNRWVDSIMQNMTVKQKIGQLFMIPAYSNKGQNHIDFIQKMIREFELGGLVFMQGTAKGHASLINRYQNISEVPLLIGIDAEWGLDMRIKNTFRFIL